MLTYVQMYEQQKSTIAAAVLAVAATVIQSVMIRVATAMTEIIFRNPQGSTHAHHSLRSVGPCACTELLTIGKNEKDLAKHCARIQLLTIGYMGETSVCTEFTMTSSEIGQPRVTGIESLQDLTGNTEPQLICTEI